MWYVDYNVKTVDDGDDCIPCPRWIDVIKQLTTKSGAECECNIYWRDDNAKVQEG